MNSSDVTSGNLQEALLLRRMLIPFLLLIHLLLSLLDCEKHCKHDYYVNKIYIDICSAEGQVALRNC